MSTNVIPFTRQGRSSTRVAGLRSSSPCGPSGRFADILPLSAGLARVVEAHNHVSPTTRAATLMALAAALLLDEHGELGEPIARVLLRDVFVAGAGAGVGAGVGAGAAGRSDQAVSPSPPSLPSGVVVAASTARTT
ncbi:MAG: hypothetical protein O9972_56360 [Burkholderiales bacterium]|nr:hypothetical protein [Burkholderiales bacterium]